MQFPNLGNLIFFFLILIGLFISLIGVILKICGVLLLSYWWIFSPAPIILIIVIFVVGLVNLSE